MDAEFVVVGAGVMGLAAGWTLARDGRDVIVLEQHEVGNVRGSSHGASRVYRTFYDDAHYASMAQRSVPLWRELEGECGADLLEVTGSIETLEGADQDRATLDALGIPYEILDEDRAAERFPDVRLPGSVLYQADTAVIAADATLAGLKALLEHRLQEGERVRSIRDGSAGAVVETDSGRISASVVLACCGSYASELLGPLGIHVALVPTLEQIVYFRHRSGSLPPALPVINNLGRPQRYGLPTRAMGAYKFAEHGTGPRIDPRQAGRDPDPAVTERLLSEAASHLPGFDPEPVRVETCVYENTPDRHFVIGRRGRVVVGTGFSGHGFKFAPLIGRILAALATDGDPAIDLEPFSLDRPALRFASGELSRPR